MKKNIRDYKRKGTQFSYLLDRIESEEKELRTDKEKIYFLFDTFKSEFDYKIKQIGFNSALKEWLSGLPSCINIDFWNDDILRIGKSWGYCNNQKKEEIFIKDWFRASAFNLIKIGEYFGVL